MSDRTGLNRQVFWLYEGTGRGPGAFRWALLVFDVVTITYFIATLFEGPVATHPWIDTAIGIVIALDLAARFWIARRKWRFLIRPMNMADAVVVISMLAPLVTQNFAFLRILRALRVARAYSFLARASKTSLWLREHHDIIDRVTNLAVFIFIMTAFVYADQAGRNEGISNYIDALYFTVTSLTTTGYGDILMVGWSGRILSIVIMLLGITLFLRLLRSIVRPSDKVNVECGRCGLQRHDPDAVHCKHCGAVVHIDTPGRG